MKPRLSLCIYQYVLLTTVKAIQIDYPFLLGLKDNIYLCQQIVMHVHIKTKASALSILEIQQQSNPKTTKVLNEKQMHLKPINSFIIFGLVFCGTYYELSAIRGKLLAENESGEEHIQTTILLKTRALSLGKLAGKKDKGLPTKFANFELQTRAGNQEIPQPGRRSVALFVSIHFWQFWTDERRPLSWPIWDAMETLR